MKLSMVMRMSPLPRNQFAIITNTPRGGEGQGEGEKYQLFSGSLYSLQVSPLIRPAATFSPDLGGEGTCERFPLKASFLTAHSIQLNWLMSRNALPPGSVKTVS